MKALISTLLLLTSAPTLAASDNDVDFKAKVLSDIKELREEVRGLKVEVETLKAKGTSASKPTAEEIDSAFKEQISKYEIARKAGALQDSCMYARLISQIALQLSKAEEYKKWKEIEKKDCEAHSKEFFGK